MVTQPVFLWEKRAAEKRLDAESTEEPRRNIGSAHSLGRVPPAYVERSHDITRAWPGSHLFEYGVLRIPVDEIGGTNELAHDALLRIALPQHH